MPTAVITRRPRCTGGPATSAVLLRVCLLFLLVLSASLFPAAAFAAQQDGSIDHTETRAGELRLFYSLPGLDEATPPDLSSLTVTIDGQPVEATATVAEDATTSETVQRTTILAIDTSNSMRGDKFTQAKQAATAFLDGAPPDVRVGLVAFAGTVNTVRPPTSDRSALTADLDTLVLTKQTRLYDGVLEALTAAGVGGQRSVLVLSDGKDTSGTPLGQVTKAIRRSDVKVDVVALEQTGAASSPLDQLASAGDGVLLTADDPDALVQVFADEAAALAKQILVSVTVPPDVAGTEGTVTVALTAGGDEYSDSAFVTLKAAARGPGPAPAAPQPVTAPGLDIPTNAMWGGLAAAGLGVLLLLLSAFGVLGGRKQATLEDRINAYAHGAAPRGASSAGAGAGGRSPGGDGATPSVSGSAVSIAEKALASNKGLERALGSRLVAAGLALKPAEWLLLHAGLAVAAAVLGYLLSSGKPIPTVVFLLAGVVLPWIYLGLKKSRRLKAFNSHLAQTLQLISGSLSAGLSLAQSVDTVVREGTEPIAGEFRKALIEARLGVQIEDALDAVATRMESEDFDWVVMAIRIQREVGGNLAELLLNVAATMRERDYLRRQVKSLSAEGRMSAVILCGLPPLFVIYLSFINPSYLTPMYTTPLGWLMIGTMVVLMVVGSFWMSRLVKVDV